MRAPVAPYLFINFNPPPSIGGQQTKKSALSGFFSLALPKIFGILTSGWPQFYTAAQNTIDLPEIII